MNLETKLQEKQSVPHTQFEIVEMLEMSEKKISKTFIGFFELSQKKGMNLGVLLQQNKCSLSS